MCMHDGRVTAARIVDHVTPHKGNIDLFYDYENTQSLCKAHHDGSKKSEEHRGYSSAVGDDGWPRDERHPVNRSRRA